MEKENLYIGIDIGGTKTAISIGTKDTHIIKKIKVSNKNRSF